MDFVRNECCPKERVNMKFQILFLLISICAIPSLPARPLPPLPEPTFVDGEVSRCYPFDQSGLGSIWIDLSAAFTGTASNNLEIAFGQDVNRDGKLSLHETDLILGWSCGCYFLERFKAGEVYDEANVGTNDFARSLGWNSRVRRNGQIVSFALTNECGAAFTDILSSQPSWLYDVNWNLVRLTRRGPGADDVVLAMDILNRGGLFLVR